MLSADDLRFFLHVVRQGRLVAAAEVLGVDHTTVSRRIGRLERDLGRRLFHRSTAGWTVTEAGEQLLVHAQAIDSAVTAAAGAGTDRGRLSGTVRIATPDAFGAFVLVPGLAPLRARHPDLDVHVVTSTRKVSLSLREFDVAVTLEEPQPRHVSYRKLTDYALRLYASPRYLADRAPVRRIEDLTGHTLIWYVDDLLDIAPLRLLDDLVPHHHVAIQTNSVTGHWQAAVAGLGIAPLPRYLADPDHRLVPVLDEVTILRSYWVAVPRESARLDRVRAAVGLLEQIAHERRADLLGEA